MLSALLAATLSLFQTRAALQLEILALRHQLGVWQRSVKKPKLNRFDRMLWSWFCATHGFYKGAEFPALQAVYPDLENRFPEDENLDLNFTQPLLQPEESFGQIEEGFWNAHEKK